MQRCGSVESMAQSETRSSQVMWQHRVWGRDMGEAGRTECQDCPASQDSFPTRGVKWKQACVTKLAYWQK